MLKSVKVLIAAMKGECDYFISRLTNARLYESEGFAIYEGELLNFNFAICISGIGEVNAALAAYKITTLYNVEYILNIGCCGAHKKHLTYGDIIIPNKIVAFLNPSKDLCYKTNNLSGILFEKIENSFKNYNKNFYSGAIFSADLWNKKKEINIIEKAYSTFGEDMECAAINYVANMKKVPFAAVKFVSNNELTNQAYTNNKELFQAFQALCYEILKIFLNEI